MGKKHFGFFAHGGADAAIEDAVGFVAVADLQDAPGVDVDGVQVAGLEPLANEVAREASAYSSMGTTRAGLLGSGCTSARKMKRGEARMAVSAWPMPCSKLMPGCRETSVARLTRRASVGSSTGRR